MAIYEEYYHTNATPSELNAVLGKGWAIARKTPRNLTLYKRCITMKEYNAAQQLALKRRK